MRTSIDTAGQRLTNKITSSDGSFRTELYSYDELNRLKTVDYGDGQTQSYSFDTMGNRASKTDAGGGLNGTESYTVNNANMLLTRGTANYTNDANGNTLTDPTHTNTWDSVNRLAQCVTTGTNAATSSFVYGSDGIRHSSTITTGGTATTTNFVLDASMFVREQRAGVNYATYLMGLRGPEYRRQDSGANTGQVRWYVYDGLGSVLAEVDPNGNITSKRKYDVYGLVRNANVAGDNAGGTSSHKFVGALGHPSEDNTGYIYMRARYMDPQTGRFASEDTDAQSANLFAYCGNNPTSNTDANGHEWHMSNQAKVDWFAAGIGFTGAALAMVYFLPQFSGIYDRAALFVCVEAAMLCFALASTGMADAPSVVLAITGFLAGITGAMVGLMQSEKAALHTEAGVAVVCLTTMAIIEMGTLASIGADIPH